MNYVQVIQDLFDYLTKYIEMVIDFLNIDELRDLLVYLYNCIPEPVRAVIFLVILLFCLAGFIKAFRN